MFGILCKRLIRDFKKKVTHLGFDQNNHNALQCIVIRSLSSSSSSSSLTSEKNGLLKSEDEQSFRVSYLIDSCGLSLEDAIIASQKAKFKNAGNPDSVLTLLRKYGFTNTHISKIVSKHPSLLSSNPDKTLHPKLEFFSSIGVSVSDIAYVLSSIPQILMRSLQNRIIPTYNLIKGLGLDDKQIVYAFRHSLSRILNSRKILSNIELLRELGVPQSSLSLLIAHFPCISDDRFVYIVKELREMGFDPSKTAFVQAINVLSFLGIANLQHKFEVYGKFGWSKDDALSAFKYFPPCMALSESKIVRKMNFLVNKMGLTSQIIARYPIVIGMSLEKRIIPRCLVVQVLLHKGLIKKDFSITTLLVRSERHFLQRYVTRFQELVPQLMDVYEGKMDIVDLGIGFKKICEIEDYN